MGCVVFMDLLLFLVPWLNHGGFSGRFCFTVKRDACPRFAQQSIVGYALAFRKDSRRTQYVLSASLPTEAHPTSGGGLLGLAGTLALLGLLTLQRLALCLGFTLPLRLLGLQVGAITVVHKGDARLFQKLPHVSHLLLQSMDLPLQSLGLFRSLLLQ